MATVQHKIFCVREFIETESATAVQRAFRLRFNIQYPTRESICRWSHQFEQIGCLCKGKSSDRPRVSEKNVRRIQESCERSPRKSTRRASRELGIPQPTVWRVLRHRLLFGSYRVQLVQALWVHLFESTCIYNTDLVVRNVKGWQRLERRARHKVDDLESEFRDLMEGISYTQKIHEPPVRICTKGGDRVAVYRQSKQVFRPIYLLNIRRKDWCRRFLGLRGMRWTRGYEKTSGSEASYDLHTSQNIIRR